ncbi:MAG: hypothetical protein ACYTDU_19200 [Planctomycetota bacterium]|jgi:hypothetical protein
MRWIAILVLLAACGRSWLRDEGSGRVAEALRSPEKSEPVLLAGDRAWMIRKGALRSEIDAFTNELAAAAARSEPWSPGPRPSTGDVVALAYPGRRLEFGTPHGFVVVQRSAGERGTRYWATVWRSDRQQLFVTAKGAAALDGAWSRLEQAAVWQGGKPWGPSQFGVWPDPTAVPFVRDVGVDLRGLAGSD